MEINAAYVEAEDMSLNEKYIEDKVVAWALKNKFLCPKVRFAERGWPDRLFLSPTGHTIFIEFKDPSITRPEPLQNYRIMELRRRGIPAFYCNNVIEGINILKAALEPTSVPEAGNSDAPQPSVSRLTIRPRSGEDQHLPSSTEDPYLAGIMQKSPDSSPTPPDDEHMAGRDREVGGLPPVGFQCVTRTKEGLIVDEWGDYSPDKP